MDPEITDVFITENKITIIDVTAARNLYQHHVEEQLPKDRTEGYRLFQVVGADFVGLITCKIKENNEVKAYIMQSCGSLFRALYLEILKDKALMELFEVFNLLLQNETRKPRKDLLI